MSVQRFLEIVAGLPEVSEREHRSMTGFRVRDKGFAYLSATESAVMVKSLREEQEALVADDPEVFTAGWGGGRFGWVGIRLDRVDPAELAEIVTEAWRLSAPKKLAAAHLGERT